jgi:hypothetical protein
MLSRFIFSNPDVQRQAARIMPPLPVQSKRLNGSRWKPPGFSSAAAHHQRACLPRAG